MVLIFDGANIMMQGYSPEEVYQEYLQMKPGLGWIHMKDYRCSSAAKGAPVDEDSVSDFVPPHLGDCRHEAILRDFSRVMPGLRKKLKRRGIPGVFIDLEPHVKGGGQFGGWSGPDGMGVAARSLCKMLDYIGIDYYLRDFDDVCASRGF